MQPLISIQEAETFIFDHLPNLGQETVTLENGVGRILAAPITADRAIPPYNRVMMDGIAISFDRFNQGQRSFAIAGTQAAGMPPLTLTDPQQCIEVMTGAILPHGCDCVIKIEDIRVESQTAQLSPSCSASSGQHIHAQGSDKQQADALVNSSSLLAPPELAIAASVGQTELTVIREPKILLITTGDEVIPPAETPLPHQIRRSHASAICSSITSQQLGKVENVHVPDTANALESSLKSALKEYDVILLTGGISMGKYDYVAPVMDTLVGAPLFHGIAQRPGKPFAFWSGETPVFALPGNPVSVMACLARYLLPSLRKMRGEQWAPTSYPLAQDVTWNAPFPGLVASHLSKNQLHATPPRNSGDYSALAGSQGICELPSTSPSGTKLHFYPW